MGCLCGVLWSFSLRGQIVVDAKTADHVHALTSVKLVKAADTTSHSSVHLTVFLFVCLHLSPSVSVVRICCMCTSWVHKFSNLLPFPCSFVWIYTFSKLLFSSNWSTLRLLSKSCSLNPLFSVERSITRANIASSLANLTALHLLRLRWLVPPSANASAVRTCT